MSILNALCVDADELTGSLVEAGYPVRERRHDVAGETEAVLAAFEELGVRATFFVPGHFLEGGAHLVRAMAEAGHEVASHGTQHVRVEALTPAAFRNDVQNSKRTLEDLVGLPVETYKAPIWSITPRCLWAYDELIEAGFRVDHSALPAVTRALGQPPLSMEPFRYADELVVVPVTSIQILGRPIPFPGGFYNAWVPFWFHRRVYDRLNRRGLPFNFYFHPFEHSPSEEQRRIYKQSSLFVSLYAAHHGRYARKLAQIRERYALAPLRDAYTRWLRAPDA